MNAAHIYDQTRAAHGLPTACTFCHHPARPDGYCSDDHAELGAFGAYLTTALRDLMGWNQ